jgi:hypothetical protein
MAKVWPQRRALILQSLQALSRGAVHAPKPAELGPGPQRGKP